MLASYKACRSLRSQQRIAHVNAFAGLLNAHYDGGPVLLITGASSPSILGRGGFQDLNQVALARPLCKRACKSNSAIIPQEIHESFATATNGRPGPVHLTIPADVLSAKVDESQIKSPRFRLGRSKEHRGW